MSAPTIPVGTYDCVVRGVEVRRRKKDQAWVLEVIVRAIHLDRELVVYQDLAGEESEDPWTMKPGQWDSVDRFAERLGIRTGGDIPLQIAKLLYSGEVIQASVTHGGGHQQIVLSRQVGSAAVAEWPDAEADSAPYEEPEEGVPYATEERARFDPRLAWEPAPNPEMRGLEVIAANTETLHEIAVPVDVDLTETAWVPQGDMPYDQWEAAGRELQRMGRAWQWWVGDWLNYGETAYGEKYAQAVETTGWANKTLRNVSWVARQIEPSRRRDDLEWSHHAEVASLERDEQDLRLIEASEKDWTVRDLRAALKDGNVSERVECPTCGSKVKPEALP